MEEIKKILDGYFQVTLSFQLVSYWASTSQPPRWDLLVNTKGREQTKPNGRIEMLNLGNCKEGSHTDALYTEL